jgi:hypothetical protein
MGLPSSRGRARQRRGGLRTRCCGQTQAFERLGFAIPPVRRVAGPLVKRAEVLKTAGRGNLAKISLRPFGNRIVILHPPAPNSAAHPRRTGGDVGVRPTIHGLRPMGYPVRSPDGGEPPRVRDSAARRTELTWPRVGRREAEKVPAGWTPLAGGSPGNRDSTSSAGGRTTRRLPNWRSPRRSAPRSERTLPPS